MKLVETFCIKNNKNILEKFCLPSRCQWVCIKNNYIDVQSRKYKQYKEMGNKKEKNEATISTLSIDRRNCIDNWWRICMCAYFCTFCLIN